MSDVRGRRRTSPWQSWRGFAALLLGAITIIVLASCHPGRDSHLVVYNQTSVPIVFHDGGRDRFVPPCSVARLVWGAAWDPEDPPTQPSPAPANPARVVLLQPGPAAEAVQAVTVWVTTTGVHVDYPIVVPSLPPCSGVPPTPAPGPYVTPPPSATP